MKIDVRYWFDFRNKRKKETKVPTYSDMVEDLKDRSVTPIVEEKEVVKEPIKETISKTKVQNKIDYKDLVKKSIKLIKKENKISYSLLQKTFKIGSKSAIKLMKMLEDQNIVGPLDKSTNPPTRKILI